MYLCVYLCPPTFDVKLNCKTVRCKILGRNVLQFLRIFVFLQSEKRLIL